MNIIILDILLEQEKKGKISKQALNALHNNFEQLVKIKNQGYNAIINWLFVKNGKEMKGVKRGFPIFKYKVTKGERILYTFGEYLSYIRKEDKNSLVLLSYAPHDKQANMANSKDFDISIGYYNIDDLMNPKVEFIEGENDLTPEEEKNLNLATSKRAKCYVLSKEQLINYSPQDIDKHAYLSEEQSIIIDNYEYDNKPTLILGGAGTGKTLISIHLLNDLSSNKNKKYAIAYFTQSNPLLDKVKKQFKEINGAIENKPDFWNINDFCQSTLGLNNVSLVDKFKFDQIYNKIASTKIKKLFSSLDIWTEIRGVLKGGMDENWKRLKPFNQQDFTDYGNIKNLEENGYIKRFKDSKYFALIKTEENGLTEKDKKIFREIKKVYDKDINPNAIILNKEDYLNLKSEFSIFNKEDEEQRNLVYEFCEQYQNYLENNENNEILLDENDLVRRYFEQNHDIKKYDFIIVDEVQDYTELQIYLLYRLCKKTDHIIFAGDIHQNVNPTLFSEEKLAKLFSNNNKSELNIVTLKENYRCQANVIKIANNIAEFRRQKLGYKKQNIEQKEEAVSVYSPSKVYRLYYSDTNFNKLMEMATTYANIAILVPNLAQKEFLIDKIGADNADIYTISEIKGMEYQYIICFNMIADKNHWDNWLQLSKDNLKIEEENRTKSRYDFNMLYVAITRAQRDLCFFDEKFNENLDNNILKLKTIKKFDKDNLHFSNLSSDSDAFYEQAQKLEKGGQYDTAINNYRRAGKADNSVEIIRCKMHLYEQEHKWEDAVKYAILAEEFANASKFSAKISNINSNTKQLCNMFETQKFYIKNFSNLIDSVYKDFDKDSINKVYSLAIDKAKKLADSLF